MKWYDSSALWAGLVAAFSTIVGVLAKRVSRKDKAESEVTLGSGWRDFARALTDEATEERKLRYEVEVRLNAIEKERHDCTTRLAALEQKYNGLVTYLESVGLKPPGWMD